MKKIIFTVMAIAGVLLMAGCPTPNDPAGGGGTTHQVGDKETVSAGSETFTMVYANDSTSMKFPTGRDDAGGEQTLDTRFWIAETETTNAVVAAVLQWAYNNGKFDTGDSSAHNYLNEDDADTVKYGNQELVDLDESSCRIDYDKTTNQFTADAGYTDHPVVEISWYGAVMICNWLTEMRDGNTNNVVYTGIDTDWDHAETLEDRTKTGYRLPDEWEWEYAGRYRGNDNTNIVEDNAGNPLYTNPYFTKGNSASGATADYNDANACQAVAWYDANSGDRTHPVGGKTANTLGLYDMSGNVWEWCFEKGGAHRVLRGGSWYYNAFYLRLGNRIGLYPSNTRSSIGFRLCRTAD